MANGAESAPLGRAYYDRKFGKKGAARISSPFTQTTKSSPGRKNFPDFPGLTDTPYPDPWGGNVTDYRGFGGTPSAAPSTADKLASAKRAAARRAEFSKRNAGPQDTRTPYQAQRGPLYGPEPKPSANPYIANLESIFRDFGKALPKGGGPLAGDPKGGVPANLGKVQWGPLGGGLKVNWGIGGMGSPPGGLNPGKVRFVGGGMGGALPDPKWTQMALANQAKALGLLQSGRAGFSQNPLYSDIESGLQAILSGQMQPYGASQQGADYGAISDMLAQSMGAQLGAAEGALAGANLRGGAAPSTSMALQSQRAGQLADARRGIGREAARQNFAALQQAQQQAADLAYRRAAAEQPYNLAEAQMMMNIGLPATGSPAKSGSQFLFRNKA